MLKVWHLLKKALLLAAIFAALAAGFGVYRLGQAVAPRAAASVAQVRGWFGAPMQPQSETLIAPLFTPEVMHWQEDIVRWGEVHDVDPNLLATVMQIESCGHPTVNSPAGAQGLFQVMPFHFAEVENMLDPDTNAMRGASFINECSRWASGDVGLTLACYNGGPSVIGKDSRLWPNEVVRYYYWGVAIYADALVEKPQSATLDEWLNAGGSRLCDSASRVTGARQ